MVRQLSHHNTIGNLLLSVLATLHNQFTASDLLSLLRHKDHTISASAAGLFCALATQCHINLLFPTNQFSDATLNVILYALACLDEEDVGLQACGTSILHVLIDHEGMLALKFCIS
jgi:hypothetical protein